MRAAPFRQAKSKLVLQHHPQRGAGELDHIVVVQHMGVADALALYLYDRAAQRLHQHAVVLDPQDAVLRRGAVVLDAQIALFRVCADHKAALHLAGPACVGHGAAGAHIQRQPARGQRVGGLGGRFQQMLGFGGLFGLAVAQALPQPVHGQQQQRRAQHRRRAPEAPQVEHAVGRPVFDRKARHGVGVADIGGRQAAGHLAQAQVVLAPVQRLQRQRGGHAVLAELHGADGRPPAPDIVAADGKAAGVVGVGDRLVEGDGQRIAPGQRHAGHGGAGQAVAHVDRSLVPHGGAKAGHRHGQRVQPLAVQRKVDFGLEFQHVGQRLLAAGHGAGKFRARGGDQAAAGQRGEGFDRLLFLRLADGKGGHGHVELFGRIARQTGQQRRVGGRLHDVGEQQQAFARRKALVRRVHIAVNGRDQAGHVQLPGRLPDAAQRAHGGRAVVGGGQHAGRAARRGVQRDLVALALVFDQGAHRAAHGGEVVLQNRRAVVDDDEITDGFAGHADVAGGDLFLADVQLDPGRLDQHRVDGAAGIILGCDKHIQLRHIDIDLLD